MAPRGMHVNASPPQHDCKPKRTSAVKAKENLEQLHGGYHVLLKSRADRHSGEGETHFGNIGGTIYNTDNCNSYVCSKEMRMSMLAASPVSIQKSFEDGQILKWFLGATSNIEDIILMTKLLKQTNWLSLVHNENLLSGRHPVCTRAWLHQGS